LYFDPTGALDAGWTVYIEEAGAQRVRRVELFYPHSLSPLLFVALPFPNPTNTCDTMAAHSSNAAALLPPPAVENESLGSTLPTCDAPDPTA
jgi:hypothetical protein